MIEDNISKDTLDSLIEQCFLKLEKTESSDSKILKDMSETLNWILVLITLFIGIYLQYYKNTIYLCYSEIFLLISKIVFLLSALLLIAYKLIHLNYVKQEKKLLNTLYTHKLELFFDFSVRKLLEQRLIKTRFSIAAFINNFKSGEFIPSYDIERKEYLKKIDRKILILANMLKSIYYIVIILFFVNIFVTAILIMNIYR